MASITEEIKKIADEIFPEIVSVRRHLHQYPELAYDEQGTADFLCEKLSGLGIEYKRNIAKTGIAAVIRGKKPGKTVGIRADMDALPMSEETGLPFSSKNHGIMHACGHDAHMSSALGAAMIINRLRDKLPGNVKIIFQPAEESIGGAERMIKEGVMKDPDVDVMIGGHVMGSIPVGKILVKHGAIMASPDDFEIVIKGKGGHGAYPHKTIDPILIGSQVVCALQSIVSRRISPLEPCVISICYFNAGTCLNVIPDTAMIGGTARSLSKEVRELLPRLIEDTVRGITQTAGADYEFTFRYLYPPTINDKHITDIFAESACKIIGEGNLIWGTESSMAGEDFAYFAEAVPATFVHIGCGDPARGITEAIHSPRFDIDEECLKIASSCFAQFVFDYLGK